jgi:hypothetical protein
MTGAFESASTVEVRSQDWATEELRNQADGHP